MKKSRFTDSQIAFILRQAEEGTTVEEVCRKAGITVQTYYRWRQKYGGLMPSEMKRLKQLDEENKRLKKLVADLSLDKAMHLDHFPVCQALISCSWTVGRPSIFPCFKKCCQVWPTAP